MVTDLLEGQSEFIPGAAGYSDKFLDVVQERCDQAGIGIALGLVKVGRKSNQRYVMRGTITFGNAWKGKKPYMLEVYADPAGSNLQVGFQLSTEEIGGVLGGTSYGIMANNSGVRIHNDPNTQRQLNGILQGFYQMVFAPTVQDLIDAVGRSRPQTNGFLGA
jgi:hypothetical protein